MTKLRAHFAKRLRLRRLEQQLTQQDLARLTGLSSNFISNLERGINTPSFETLESLSKALKVPARYFFDSESSDK